MGLINYFLFGSSYKPYTKNEKEEWLEEQKAKPISQREVPNVIVKAETAKAMLVIIPNHGEVWLPNSQVRVEGKTLIIPEWLCASINLRRQ